MSTYEITIDPSLCSGYGACVDAARTSSVSTRAASRPSSSAETDDPAALDAADRARWARSSWRR